MSRVTGDSRQVSTSIAARNVGVGRSTLWRWIKAGWIVPHARTAGGHLRWDVDRLREEVNQLRLDRNEQHMTEPAASLEPQPVVAAVVVSHLGVLVGKRNDGKPPWAFVTGEMEPGEGIADAAVREVKEGAGLMVRTARREIGRCVDPKTGRTVIYLVCLPVEGTDIHVGDPEELAEVCWIGLSEIDALLPGVYEPVREHLERVLA